MNSLTVPRAPSRHDLARQRREQAVTIIQQRAHDPSFGVAMLADELHLSIRQLYRCFAGHVSPTELLVRTRIASAVALMLVDPEIPVADLTVSAGFSDPSTLRCHLLRYTGMGARELRRAIRAHETRARPNDTTTSRPSDGSIASLR
ncbi:MAG: helix-turn-helix protein [Microbacterium sp.]|jgi:transcriptional regulator GlxA family with amidase domain|uniref:helix-turn-helix domain-containing protein n=1 Tax=Microbacterium sp. TaxID=51671 RepID=UPI002601FE33|nr:helix-turn-helix domain-containing protein [Microbacterium sp.]MDF2561593.1 helix-turn-helix protein [Microbacterium sp.]